MSLYERFAALNLDTAPLGFEKRSPDSGYYCTPPGAQIFGWAGVDGIHYCFVPGCGDRVFAVSPMNPESETVHILARSFADFLRLVLACGSADALEQAYGWSRGQFDAYLREYPPTDRQKTVLAELQEQLGLEPMADPFSYLQQVQAEFEVSRLRPDMPEPEPQDSKKWQVFFTGSGRERAGREIAVRQWFDWSGQRCCIPSVYLCGKGLVIDICAQVLPEQIRAFMEKWHLAPDSDSGSFSRAQHMQMSAEHPLRFDVTAQIQWGRQTLRWKHASGSSWVPFLDDQCPETARQAVEHYGLDPAFGWAFRRVSLPWATRRRPALQPFRVTLSQEPDAIPGPQLSGLSSGDCVTIIHPVNGTRYELTVQDIRQETLSFSRPKQDAMDFPTHFTQLQYTLEPDLPGDRFSVSDSVPGDPPRPKAGKTSPCGASIGIIGGADGPTALFVNSGTRKAPVHTACSSLHFEPAGQVAWQTAFYDKSRPDITVAVVPAETAD